MQLAKHTGGIFVFCSITCDVCFLWARLFTVN
jgi:hypothetical protein